MKADISRRCFPSLSAQAPVQLLISAAFEAPWQIFLVIVFPLKRSRPHPHAPAFSFLCPFLKRADLIAGRPGAGSHPVYLS